MTMFQTAMLLGMGIGQTLIAICPKGLMRETVTWLTVLLAFSCLMAQTVFAGHFSVG